jgi:dolichol-phosphate mannosyltransferase
VTVDALLKRLFGIDFIRFCLVGSSGFLLNFGLLTLLYRHLGLPVFAAQLLSAEVALFSNFLLHHHWTYKHRQVIKSLGQLLIEFHVTSWLAIIGSALIVSGGVKLFHWHYGLALVVASAAALLWNYSWTRFHIWRPHSTPGGQA